jgi:hypothetical protein
MLQLSSISGNFRPGDGWTPDPEAKKWRVESYL